MFFIQPAYAQAAAGGSGFDIMSMLPLLAIFVIFWFLILRPQQKKMKEHQAMLNAIEVGDEIITQGGIAGRVRKVGEQFMTLEIANNVEIQVQRSAVGAKLEKGTLKSL